MSPGRHAAEPLGPVGRIGRVIARGSAWSIAVWVVLVALGVLTAVTGTLSPSLFDRLSSEFTFGDSESQHADDLLAGGDEGGPRVTLAISGVDVTDPGVAAAVADVAQRVTALGGVDVIDPLAIPRLPDGSIVPQVAPLISEGDDGVLLTATIIGGGASQDEVAEALTSARDDLRRDFPDATVEVGSSKLLVDSIIEQSEKDLTRGETVALPIALVVMLVVFGGFIAAGLPLVGAIVSIIGTLGALLATTYVMEIDTNVVNVVTAVGLGLSIDYGLLLVSRFREEARKRPGEAIPQLVGHALDSAGRTVLFSGLTFAIAAAGMLAFETRIIRVLGLGALLVTVVALLATLTLTPALLSVAGKRLLRPGLLTRIPGVGRALTRFGDVAPDEGVFSRLARIVQRHPAAWTLAGVVVLLALGSPLLSLRITLTSLDVVPTASPQHAFVTTLEDEFPDAAAARVQLVARTEADLREWSAEVARLDGVDAVGEPAEVGDAWTARVRVDPGGGLAVVGAIRADRPDFEGWVTGADARIQDLSSSILRDSPVVALVIALGTIALLFLMTGSLVIPLKALVASALSLGASAGVLAWGFQQGNFAWLLGIDLDRVYGVDVLALVLTLVFGFGLAMDYELFILSRVKELHDAGRPPSESIPRGLQRSGRIITSAALIIIIVFLGFATGELMLIKQLGIALAVAIALDATLVRMVLVPAVMTWGARVMWWAPRWLKAVHRRIGFSE